MSYISLPLKLLKNHAVPLTQATFRRPFYWLTVIFNRVDEDRVEKVGPDRACSEWCLRNGAAVKWKGLDDYLKDYNLLPDEEEHFVLQAVDATDSDIHHIGFHHFKDCKHIEEVKLVRCRKVMDEAMPLLSYLKNSLVDLTITDCKNLTSEGLFHLSKLSNLESLKIGEFPYVEDKDVVISHLSKALPKCRIIYD